MIFEREFVNYDLGCGGRLEIDPQKLMIVLAGATGDPEFGKFDFENQAGSFDELEKVYLERVVPYFKQFNCYDIVRNRDISLPVDLRKELGEEATVQEVPVQEMAGEGPLDKLVANACTLLRTQINAAVGPAELALHSVVFVASETSIAVMLNVPSLEGKTNSELSKLLGGDDNWLDGEFSESGAWSIEMSPVEGMGALEPYGDPDNYYERCFSQLMYLACALLEKQPGLRSNVTIAKNFRVLITDGEDAYVDKKLRSAAKRRMGNPAKEYFDATQ